MKKKIEYGKEAVTRVEGNRIIESSQSIAAGKFISPKKIYTEESIEVKSRGEQDAEYVRFADEEERYYKSGGLVSSEFQIRRTLTAAKRGSHYVVKKFTRLDNDA